MRWLSTKISKKKTTVSNQLVIEKGQISVAKNNSTLLSGRTTTQKFSFIPTGYFMNPMLYVHSERPQKTINKKRHKRDGASKGLKRKSYKEVKKLGCRLRSWHLDFSQVIIHKAFVDYYYVF